MNWDLHIEGATDFFYILYINFVNKNLFLYKIYFLIVKSWIFSPAAQNWHHFIFKKFRLRRKIPTHFFV